jgi:hypothetical protein
MPTLLLLGLIFPRSLTTILHQILRYSRIFRTNRSQFINFRPDSISRSKHGYLSTGKLEFIDIVAYVDLFGAGVNYQLMDTERIEILATTALRKYLSSQKSREVRARAVERGNQKVIELVDEITTA